MENYENEVMEEVVSEELQNDVETGLETVDYDVVPTDYDLEESDNDSNVALYAGIAAVGVAVGVGVTKAVDFGKKKYAEHKAKKEAKKETDEEKSEKKHIIKDKFNSIKAKMSKLKVDKNQALDAEFEVKEPKEIK